MVEIENRGTLPIEPLWDYSGEVVLKDSLGHPVEPLPHSFARGDASYMVPVVENGLITQRWVITVKVRFGKPVENGIVQVVIRPGNRLLSQLSAEQRITVESKTASVASCSAAIVNKLGAPFVSDLGKDVLDALASDIQALGCDDRDWACQVPPLVKGFVKVLVRHFSDVRNIPLGKVIVGIWGVFDQDALQVCRDPANYAWQLVREFNSEGVPISAAGMHSPALVWVTDSVGRKTGFPTEEQMLTEIPNSRAMEWEGDRFVVYPADSSTIVSLQGSGTGAVVVSVIDGTGSEELVFSVDLSDKTTATLDLTDPRQLLHIDDNGDGATDISQSPGITRLGPSADPTPTTAPSTQRRPGICGGSLSMIGIMFFAIVRNHGQRPPEPQSRDV